MSERGHRAAIAGTPRPRNRKAQIITAAGDLFYRFGYHNVGTEDIADAVGITAGALYRHFRSKQDLLASAVIDSFDRAVGVLEERGPDQLGLIVRGLAETAGERRDLGILWNRETRHLDDERRKRMRRRFFAFLAYFADALHDARDDLSRDDADLLAWCALAVLTSPSYHRTAISRERMIDLLDRMTLAACTTELPTVTGSPGGPAGEGEVGVPPGSRREALLAAAATLFSRRGYQTVTMEEVGAAVGVTSTSVYRHFATKAELLMAIVGRGQEALSLGLSRALAGSATPRDALDNVVRAYIQFAMDHHDLVGVLVAEVMNLPQPHRHRIRKAQHEYVAEWVRLIEATHPEFDRVEATFRAHAVLTVINDVSRTAHVHNRPGVPEALIVIAERVRHG